MPGPQPTLIVLSTEERQILEQFARRRSEMHGLGLRAKIILAAAAGQNNQVIGLGLQIHRRTAGFWRERWLAESGGWQDLAEEDVRQKIRELLSDAPRSGAPATFTAEQICQIVAVACEKPEDCGRPVTHWTPSELATEVKKRHIVKDISPRSVGRFLKRGRS